MNQKIKQDFCIGANLRILRIKAGLTQEQVSIKMQLFGLNMSRDFYAHIENGTYNIRASELVALRSIFQCDYADFFVGMDCGFADGAAGE